MFKKHFIISTTGCFTLAESSYQSLAAWDNLAVTQLKVVGGGGFFLTTNFILSEVVTCNMEVEALTLNSAATVFSFTKRTRYRPQAEILVHLPATADCLHIMNDAEDTLLSFLQAVETCKDELNTIAVINVVRTYMMGVAEAFSQKSPPRERWINVMPALEKNKLMLDLYGTTEDFALMTDSYYLAKMYIEGFLRLLRSAKCHVGNHYAGTENLPYALMLEQLEKMDISFEFKLRTGRLVSMYIDNNGEEYIALFNDTNKAKYNNEASASWGLPGGKVEPAFSSTAYSMKLEWEDSKFTVLRETSEELRYMARNLTSPQSLSFCSRVEDSALIVDYFFTADLPHEDIEEYFILLRDGKLHPDDVSEFSDVRFINVRDLENIALGADCNNHLLVGLLEVYRKLGHFQGINYRTVTKSSALSKRMLDVSDIMKKRVTLDYAIIPDTRVRALSEPFFTAEMKTDL